MRDEDYFKHRIIFEDGTDMYSHDKDWNQITDHAHALAPHNTKKWAEYHVIFKDDFFVLVSFVTGIFVINGQLIHLADEAGEALTNREEPQDFEPSNAWKVVNGQNYFPVVGRRVFKGIQVDATIPFLGWKILKDGRKIQKLCYVYPNHQVVLE